MRRIQLRPLLEDLQHDRRATQRDQEAHENGCLNRLTESPGQEVDHETGQRYLERSTQYHPTPDPDQASERELDSDGEEQENHPHLGQDLHLVDSLNEPESVRPRQNPREQKAEDHWEASPVEKQHNHQGQAEDDGEVGQERDGHRISSGIRSPSWPHPGVPGFPRQRDHGYRVPVRASCG